MVRRPTARAPLGRGTWALQTRVVHGHRRAFVLTGSGPALLLLHGLGCDHTTWSPVIARLRRRFTVIAPDLLGHGRSAKPRGDYSLGGYANGMRDLLALLDIDRATVVGHSFGGGVAMQFAYQFPQYTERLMLVAPGGLGREVNPLLRALTLPGAGPVLAVAASAAGAGRRPPRRHPRARAGGCPGFADVARRARGAGRAARPAAARRLPARAARGGGLARPGGDHERTAPTWRPTCRHACCGASGTPSSRPGTRRPPPRADRVRGS